MKDWMALPEGNPLQVYLSKSLGLPDFLKFPDLPSVLSLGMLATDTACLPKRRTLANTSIHFLPIP